MSRRSARMMLACTVGGVLFARPGLQGQGTPLGTFRWQLQPHCNVLTLMVVQHGAQFHLDGTDDQCGAAQKASVVGLAFFNPDGSVGFGLTTVTAPGGTPIHLDATISTATLGGTWRDSAGHTGALVFTPGAGTGGSPRPVPPGGLPPGSITATQIAPGAITAGQLAPGAIAATVAAFGTCPAGQYLRGIQPNGTVLCEPIGTPPLSTTVDDPANLVGFETSIAIGIDGLPVISHRDLTLFALRVTHCGNVTCTAGNVSTTVDDPVNSVGVDTSIAIGTDGLPIISHRDATASALRVTHCSNVTCTAGTSTTVDDPANSVGSATSIAIGADGLPVISHHDVTAGALRVTHCGNVTCTAGTVSTTVDDPANSVGSATSNAIGTDGLPIISHLDVTAGALRVTHCGNVICTAGTVSTTLDDPANLVGFDTSIAIGTDGLPVISHHDNTALAPRVTHCGNVTCTAGTVSTTVDDPANAVGFNTSIAIGTDGLPVISHHDFTAGALRVTHCGNVTCMAGAVSTTVDDPANQVGFDTSIAIGTDGLPVISHQDGTADALRVTKCASRTCQ